MSSARSCLPSIRRYTFHSRGRVKHFQRNSSVNVELHGMSTWLCAPWLRSLRAPKRPDAGIRAVTRMLAFDPERAFSGPRDNAILNGRARWAISIAVSSVRTQPRQIPYVRCNGLLGMARHRV